MTQTDPIAAAAQVSPPPAPAPAAPAQVPNIPDEAWKTTLAIIGGMMGGDRYPSNTPPPLPGPAMDTAALSDMTMGNEQQQLQEQAIAQENKMLSQQNSAPPGGTPGEVSAGGGDWRVAVLAGIGAPDTPENLDLLAKWQKAEGGGGVAGGPTPSNYNWLNTTRNMPGATSINSVGVKSYASFGDGVAATVAALNNGLYGNIISALRNGNDEYAVAQAIANSPWGTGSLVLRMLQPSGGPTRLR